MNMQALNQDSDISRLLADCLEQGIELEVVDGQLDIYTDNELCDQLLGRLKQHKNALLALLSSNPDEVGIEAIARDRDGYPLSSAQQRIWFVDKFEQGTTNFNICAAVEVKGQIDLAKVAAAFNFIVERHEPLRTVFVEPSGRSAADSFAGIAMQQLLGDYSFTLEQIDIAASDEFDFNRQVKQQITTASKQPFDLEKDLMVRGVFYRHNANHGVLLFTLHHIAGDGWSLGILVKEFVQCYRALSEQQVPLLPSQLAAQFAPLPVQYIDYAHWQQQNLASAAQLKEQQSYWQRQLAGAPFVHSVPMDFPRAALDAIQGNERANQQAGVCRSIIETDVASQLQAIAKDQQMTLFMVLHGILALTLSRHSHSQDIIIGTIIANRQQVELENLIGCFVNTLALRTRTDFTEFSQLLAHVKAVNLAAQQHSQIQLEQVADLLEVPAGSDHMRLVQIVFSMDTSDKGQLQLPNLSLDIWPRHDETGAKFDLEIVASINQGAIEFDFIYNRALFRAERIERLARHVVNLANLVAEDSHLRLAQMPMLGNGEVAYLLELANLQGQSLVSEYHHSPLLDHLNHQFSTRGQQVALVVDNLSISFAQLERRTNDIASYLLESGIDIGERVGLCAEDGFDLVAGFFAVLSIGAVVVPVASDYPQSRIAHIISDSAMKMLLVCHSNNRVLSQYQANPVALVEIKQIPASDKSDATSCPAIDAEQGAYIIYTSGSTGVPKGVVISHQNWASYMLSVQALYQPSSDDRVLQFSSPAFDIFIEELSLSILSGGCLVFNSEVKLPNSREFWQLLAIAQVSICSLPTAYWHGLCSDDKLGEYVAATPLRTMILGGEALQIGQLKRWQQANVIAHDKIALFNTYGPTETTVIATAWQAEPLTEHCHTVPIGKPVASSAVFVLDDDNHFVPFGAVGELCIAGPTLALGYHGLATQTQAQFVQIPLGAEVLRVYRTGDLVRYLDDENLIFIGRKDRQVKIRGYRIEPGEVEQVITAIDGVNDVAVVAEQQHSEHHNSWRLLAYLSGDIANQQLQQQLDIKLADYMQPSVVVRLAQLPLTENGKLDYRALPALADVEPSQLLAYGQLAEQPNASIVAPTTATEQQLVDIWAQALDIELTKVSIDGSFFKLGGDSILAVRLLAMVNQNFDVDISLRDFFSRPTVKQLALSIAERIDNQQPPVIDVQVSDEQIVPASSQQQRIWLLQQLSDNLLGAYNIFHCFNLRGDLQVVELKQAFAAVVASHDSLRCRFFTQNNRLMQQLNSNLAVEDYCFYHDLTALAAPIKAVKAAEIAKFNRQYSFDLNGDCLLRVDVVKLADSDYQLMICVHHIAADGWSVGLLTRALNLGYRSLIEGQAVDLPQGQISYRDYSLWQQQHGAEAKQNTALRYSQQYWQQQLQGLPLCHDLPLDHLRPARQTYSAQLWQHQLPAKLTQGLRQMATERDVSLFMLLHSIFALLLARYSTRNSNNKDIVIGTPVANRPLQQQQDVIGCFINTLVLRTKVDESSCFNQLLSANKAMILDGFAHQDLGFETLVEHLAVERNTAFSPLFQVMMVLHNNRRLALDLAGVEVLEQQSSDTYSAGAKYDLTLNIFDCDGDLTFDWEFNPDLFDTATIAQMAEHWQVLAQLLLEPSPAEATANSNAEINVWQLPIASDQDLGQSVAAIDSRCSQTPLALFAQQVKANPNKVAVEAGDEQLSYQQLADRVNRLAQKLKNQGIKPNDRVAIQLAHQLDLPVAILAVMKSGATYVPLDIDIPPQRQQHIVVEADILLVITESYCVDELNGSLALESENFEVNCRADDCAYILFTSGSTGQPKGVKVSHGALANLLLSMAKRPGFSQADRLLAVTPLSFDISGLELLLPLICGGTLVVGGAKGGKQLATDAEALGQLLVERHITMMQATPTMWRILLDGGWQGKADLIALCGGEALNLEQAHALAAKTKQLWNMYGPTETTIWSFCAQITTACQQVSIGEPIDNTGFCILDSAGLPVPSGVVGELYICGAGLAEGYLNRDDLSATVFVEFAQRRWYATGDLVRVSRQQGLIFMGRVDHQIKLRGFRIEPAEIENCLNQHDQISDSLVVLDTDQQSNRQSLVAYYVGPSSQPSVSQLRSHIAAHLPAYMVPNVFIALERFALTSSGKKDRKALPKPQASLTCETGSETATYVAPQNQLEQFIAEQLKQLLRREQISSHENFFELGATSLDLVNLAQKITIHLGHKLSAVELFDKTTVEQLAQYLEQQGMTGAGAEQPSEKLAQRSAKRRQGKSRLQARLNRRSR